MQTNMLIAGVDEAGRGALAGPVFAAAVILNPEKPITGLADSKKLSAKTRARLRLIIQERALAWAVAQASVAEIDNLNILQASLLAMQRAVNNLNPLPTKILVDGRDTPAVACMVQTIVGGDATEPAISAASILAKVFRDEVMSALHGLHPRYEFAQHKGYGTAVHLATLKKFGPCVAHRLSYTPVRLAIKDS